MDGAGYGRAIGGAMVGFAVIAGGAGLLVGGVGSWAYNRSANTSSDDISVETSEFFNMVAKTGRVQETEFDSLMLDIATSINDKLNGQSVSYDPNTNTIALEAAEPTTP